MLFLAAAGVVFVCLAVFFAWCLCKSASMADDEYDKQFQERYVQRGGGFRRK